MPVVIGQQTFTRCFFASAARISLIVISLPLGTRRMTASTSSGAGITIVPRPQRGHAAGNAADFGQAFVVGQFFAPRFALRIWAVQAYLAGISSIIQSPPKSARAAFHARAVPLRECLPPVLVS